MRTKHQTSQYKHDARLLRNWVNGMHALGLAVTCWRCGRDIAPGQPFDAGHTGRTPTDLAPEHRHATAYCEGNRANGGTIAATNHAARRAPTGGTTTWKL